MPGDIGECDTKDSLERRFRDVVTSVDELQAVIGQPQKRTVAKVIEIIDEHARRFIAHSPFIFVA